MPSRALPDLRAHDLGRLRPPRGVLRRGVAAHRWCGGHDASQAAPRALGALRARLTRRG